MVSRRSDNQYRLILPIFLSVISVFSQQRMPSASHGTWGRDLCHVRKLGTLITNSKSYTANLLNGFDKLVLAGESSVVHCMSCALMKRRVELHVFCAAISSVSSCGGGAAVVVSLCRKTVTDLVPIIAGIFTFCDLLSVTPLIFISYKFLNKRPVTTVLYLFELLRSGMPCSAMAVIWAADHESGICFRMSACLWQAIVDMNKSE